MSLNSGVEMTVGETIDGKYEIIGFLGEGGFSKVHRARHILLDRPVALKVLKLRETELLLGYTKRPTTPMVGASGEEVASSSDEPVVSQGTLRDRFVREANIVARLRHPNTVSIYDVGVIESSGALYLAMALLSGHDLAYELDQGPLEPTRALPLFVDALDGLAAGHQQGVIHKDLKPANLFLATEGGREKLVILDFGVARVDMGAARLTLTGQLSGTPQYLPPEYFEEQAVSPALDVYQMGLILGEMLTARPAIPHDLPHQCYRAHAKGELNFPASLYRGALGEVFQKATNPEPTARYRDAAEFRDALAALEPATIVIEDGPPFFESREVPDEVTPELERPRTIDEGVFERLSQERWFTLETRDEGAGEPSPAATSESPRASTNVLERGLWVLLVLVVAAVLVILFT